MTGRYTRKTVPLEVDYAYEVEEPDYENDDENDLSSRSLDRASMTGDHCSGPGCQQGYTATRGLSRESQGEETHRPYPEPADAPLQSSYSYGYAYGYDESYNSYGEQSYRGHPHSSGHSSPTHTDGSRSVSISNGWTTGNTTERSSIYSFGEDAFDRKASQRVRQMFEHIDRILFEQHTGPQNLYTECEVWTNRFPHIRILGNQLLPPQDNGYQMVSGSPRTYSNDSLLYDVTEQDITASHGFNELSITGQHVDARVPPVESLAQLSENRDPETTEIYEKEEVFAQDGHVEDIIAVDYKTADEDCSDKNRQHRISTRQRHTGMPPMTPQACVKDNIGSSIFDLIWTEVISWLRDILRKYAQIIQYVDSDVDEQRSSAMALPLMQSPGPDILPPSRELSLINSSRLADRNSRPPMSAASQSPDGRGLDGLLTISTKALQSRGAAALGEQLTAEALERVLPLTMAIQGVRPGSSTARYARPGSVKPQDTRLTSARLRTAGRGRLAPLERAKTPSMDEDRQILQNEVLRGRKLTTLNDNRFSPTPPLTFHRNGALPPIGLDQEAPKKSILTGRASSAVNDKEGRLPFKDRDREKMAVGLETRPSTTHAMYRSDTPFSNRQTTTPLGFSSNRVAAISGLGKALAGGSNTNVLHLDVRGSGINPHVNEGDTPDLVDTEHLDEMIHSQWGAYNSGGGANTKRRLSVPIGHSFPPLRVRPGPAPVTSPRHSRSSTRASSAASDEASLQYGLSKMISATAPTAAVDSDYLHSSYLQT